MKSKKDKEEERVRLNKANLLLKCIALTGRNFFKYDDEISFLTVDRMGHIWLYDSYSKKMIYTRYNGKWRGFSHGGTMKNLVVALTEYVKTGKKLSRSYFWFPDWVCDGDLWGYGRSMKEVQEAVIGLDLLEDNKKGKETEK